MVDAVGQTICDAIERLTVKRERERVRVRIRVRDRADEPNDGVPTGVTHL